MLIKYQVKKDVSQEEIDKYKLKMFKKRRKLHTFAVGDKVRMVFANKDFVPKSKRWHVEYYGKICFGEELKVPEYVVIEYITKTEIKAKDVAYYFRKEIFEVYEYKLSNEENS